MTNKSTKKDRPDCSLCGNSRTEPYYQDRFGRYAHCPVCDLVFLYPADRLDAAGEKARYDLHQNRPDDPGYRAFLSRLATPFFERLPEGAQGFDFGSGPDGGGLAVLFRERGWEMARYDPFYAPDESVWTRTWDFITTAETIEHLYSPGAEFDRLFRVLRPGGWLGIMTGRRPDREAFGRWHYRRDETHVAFYSAATLRWIATRWQVELEEIDPTVTLLRKPRSLFINGTCLVVDGGAVARMF